MQIFDVVQITEVSPNSSYPNNSRVLIEFHSSREIAKERCCLFNEKRVEITGTVGFYYVVEEHEETSATRANPIK